MSRKPIYLNKNAVALITVFTRPDHVEDLWITDYHEYDEDYKDVAEEAARQFMEQLEGRYNKLFLRALKKEINKRLKYVDEDSECENNPIRLRFTDVLKDNIFKGY